MNTTQTIPSVDAKKTIKKPSKTFTNTALLALGIFIAGGLLGAFLVNRNMVPPMQGNEACKGAMAAQVKQLQADLNAGFATPKPEGTPTLADVQALQKKCDETFTMYTVKVEATK